MTPNDEDKKIDRLEKMLWEAKKQAPQPVPGDNFEKKVLSRIQEQKAHFQDESIIVVMNRLSWKILPAAASLLFFLGVLSFSQEQKNSDWLDLMIGQDAVWNSTWFEEGAK